MKKSYAEQRAHERERTMVLVTLFFILVVVFGSAFYVWWPRGDARIPSPTLPELGEAVEGELPSLIEEERRVFIPRGADGEDFIFRLNELPVFITSQSAGTLRIENPSHNTYPLSVEIYLTRTGERVYNSGGVLPNHHISAAKLDVELPKGLHAATAFVNAYDHVTGEYNGRVVVGMTLIVMS